MEYINQSICIGITELTDENAFFSLDELFNNYDKIKEALLVGYSKLKEKALENGKIAVDLYEKGSVKLGK